MAKLIVLVSGNVGVGKSTLVRALESHFGTLTLKTREVMQELASKQKRRVASERVALQLFGEKLDRDTKGAWVLNALKRVALGATEEAIVVVDAVRILDQIKQIRRAYGFQVKHIHLTAPTDVLESRYTERLGSDIKELGSYTEVAKNPTEAAVIELQDPPT